MAASSLQLRVALRWASSTLAAETLRSGARVELSGLLPALADQPAGLTRLEVGPDEALITLPRGDQERLRDGDERSIELARGLWLEAQAHRENTRALRAPGPARLRWFVAGSLAVHAALGCACTTLTGAERESREERLERAREYLVRAESRAEEQAQEEIRIQEEIEELWAPMDSTGARVLCEQGTMCRPDTRPHNPNPHERGDRRPGIASNEATSDPEAARLAALKEAAEFGVVGLFPPSATAAEQDPPSTKPGKGPDQRAASYNDPGGGLAGLDPRKVAPWGAWDAEPTRDRGAQAGERDDNERYRHFIDFVEKNRTPKHRALDVRDRQFIVVRDSEGRGAPGCTVSIESSKASVTLRTRTSGRALLFPHAEGVSAPYEVSARCDGLEAQASVARLKEDAVILLDIDGKRAPSTERRVDVAFVLDTTASMHGEIEAVKATLGQITRATRDWRVSVRVGLVEFRDHSSSFVTRIYPFSDDIDAFAENIASVQAGEGGDDPEAVDAGLHAALSGLDWGERSARVAFLIGDAPPHLGETPPDKDHVAAARRAARMGVAIHTVAASGMNPDGHLVFRQIAQFTGATSVHILREGDPFASLARKEAGQGCQGGLRQFTTGNLDQLLLKKIGHELAALDASPLEIGGLGHDAPLPRCGSEIAAAARPWPRSP